ncbi:MAG: RdgB/HAM1 family non-canonical purine NTP pyrophosphatase [Oscillospiraceae bacterium]|jgi:XTP/dITP diphosphohydrolase|nr:RdgB/HAM1 family non-canonical purine NTP pyrophosphatase [Oscillospiraceae bacterium]
MQTIVLATHNPGKAREFARLLGPAGFTVKTLADYGVTEGPEETGATFLENARIKARAAMEATGLPALADDSGLCVDALGGAPGVLSARFAPSGKRTETLLRSMEGRDDRKARFVCALALAYPAGDGYPDGREITAEGFCEGEIAEEPGGTNGFGYDPIFFLPEKKRTMAQLTPEEKDAVSHRGAAIRALLKSLKGT